MSRWSAGGPATEIGAALAPYAWRNLTARMLARRAVGAVDRYTVLTWLSDIPGTEVGMTEPVECAEPGDERVEVLVRLLESRRWRGSSLDRLSADLSAALEVWPTEHELFHTRSRRLFDDR